MTDPTGLSFLSYKRSRKAEAELLIAAQHDVGIPTWRDLDNLEEEPLEARLEEVLASPSTANALLWITPEVKDADVIRKIEAPLILRRKQEDDLFFVVPVAAGALDYKAAGEAIRDPLYTTQHLENWNLRKVERDPITPADAAEVAGWVLERRIEALHRTLSADAPLPLSLYTREKPPEGTGMALSLDWSHRFGGFEAKEASPGAWEDFLCPALRKVAGAVAQKAPGRGLVAQGLASLPAAFGLGWAFMAPRRIPVTWQQVHPEDGSRENWSLAAVETPSGFEASPPEPGELGSRDLAVLVNARSDAEAAFRASHPDPRFRAILRIGKPGESLHQLAGPGEAKHLAKLVVQSLREARGRYPEIECIHLFLAGPLGLAMMIGQLSNTLGTIQTYDHVRAQRGITSLRSASRPEPRRCRWLRTPGSSLRSGGSVHHAESGVPRREGSDGPNEGGGGPRERNGCPHEGEDCPTRAMTALMRATVAPTRAAVAPIRATIAPMRATVALTGVMIALTRATVAPTRAMVALIWAIAALARVTAAPMRATAALSSGIITRTE